MRKTKKKIWRDDKRWGGKYDYFSKENLMRLVKVNVCGVCLHKPIDKQLHHIEYFCDGGLNEPENLCWLCEKCHTKLHRYDFNLFRKIKFRKMLLKLKSKGII